MAPPMSELSASTHVAASLDEVFQVYTQIDKAAERIPEITSIEVLSDGPFGEGFRWRETRLMFKKEATEEMWVTGFDPPRSYTVEAESHGSHYGTLFTFEPIDEGTRVTWTFKATPRSLMAKILAPIFNGMMKGMMKT